VVDLGVIAEETHGGDIAAALEAVGDSADEAEAAGLGDVVHVGSVGGLEGGFAGEFGEGFVSGAVGDDDGVFHMIRF